MSRLVTSMAGHHKKGLGPDIGVIIPGHAISYVAPVSYYAARRSDVYGTPDADGCCFYIQPKFSTQLPDNGAVYELAIKGATSITVLGRSGGFINSSVKLYNDTTGQDYGQKAMGNLNTYYTWTWTIPTIETDLSLIRFAVNRINTSCAIRQLLAEAA